jgi:hypothetical protein
LEPRWLKDLRTVVRKNEYVIGDFVEKLFEEFHKSNADRRFGAMLISDYFFQRSHKFRTEILDHIQVTTFIRSVAISFLGFTFVCDRN